MIQHVISQLKRNRKVFKELLSKVPEDLQAWKYQPEAWSLKEVICHLRDEENEDFRARVASILEDPTQPLKPIDPSTWVTERNYHETHYKKALKSFLRARKASIEWLEELDAPEWDNTYEHATLGPMSARLFMANWLAHDYLHIRQINRIKYEYLRQESGLDLSYAGNW